MSLKCILCKKDIGIYNIATHSLEPSGIRKHCGEFICDECCKACKEDIFKDKRECPFKTMAEHETILDKLFSKFGRNYIHNSVDGIQSITDFCLSLCKERGCKKPEQLLKGKASAEEKDDWLCDCTFDDCPVARAYASFNASCGLRDMNKRNKTETKGV